MDQKTKEIALIDFEYASLNYRGFDIANHFIEWGADYHSAEPHLLNDDLFPALDQRLEFYSYYLQNNSQETLLEFDKEVMHFVNASHLLWGLWGIVREGHMTTKREIDFDFWEYGISRLEKIKI